MREVRGIDALSEGSFIMNKKDRYNERKKHETA